LEKGHSIVYTWNVLPFMIDVEFAANSLQFLEIEKLGKLSLLIIELFSDCTRIAGLMTGFSLFNKLRKY
jgi:hypothetical protein